MAKAKVRIAAMSDVHCTKSSQGTLQPLFAQAAADADVLLLCGDLTDYGTEDEAHVLLRELAGTNVPVIAVLGNHDHETGEPDAMLNVLRDGGIKVLDGEATEVCGVGFAGTKGFAGGFGRGTLGSWGEPAIKSFVKEAVDEALRLEAALVRLRTPQRICLLHYAPVQATVEGEPPEIYAFLGTSRLEEPLVRYPVTAVFHGHAHNGTHAGYTSTGTPVYNVALPLMRRVNAERPYMLLEIDPAEPPAETHGERQDAEQERSAS